MSRKFLLVLIIPFMFLQIYSQSDIKPISFGIGGGIGFFYPQDINRYLNDNYSSYMLTSGVYDMFLYFVVNAKGSFFFTKNTELQLEAEWAFSPKFIAVDGEADTYFYHRLTPAVKFHIHFPLRDDYSVYFGPGINWNRMKLNTPNGSDYHGNCIGFSGQGGVMVRFEKSAMQPFVTVNIINSKNIEDGLTTSISNFSFTGVQIGNIYFF